MAWKYVPQYACAAAKEVVTGTRRTAISWTGDTGDEFKPEQTSRNTGVRRYVAKETRPQTDSGGYREEPAVSPEEMRERFAAKLKKAMEDM